MKKFNLFNEIIITKKEILEQAVNSGNQFGIDVNGEIKYEPFSENDIFIYLGKPANITLGKNYQVVEDGDRVLIKAFSNWQELIGINTPRASYDDTTADGVGEFSHKELEDIGWNATEFNIDYRTLVEILEEKCDGTILCIEQEDPYQFSGLGYVGNIKQAKDALYSFCQTKAKDMIENDPEFKREELTDDEEEAAQFFKIV